MNKEKLFDIALIALPVVAVGISATDKSVTILNREAGTTVYQSYFELLPEEAAMTMATPLAAILACIAAILAIVYVVTRKQKSIVGVYIATFASIFAAELPTVMQSELLILPNVVVPILLIVDCFLAYSRMKKPVEEKEKAEGRRLQMRR